MKSKIRWQSTKRQRKFLMPLDEIKKKYAKEVVSFMQTLPSDLQGMAYWWASDVGLALSFELTKTEIQRKKMKGGGTKNEKETPG